MSEGDRAPTQVRIEILINIDGLTLAVTYTPAAAEQAGRRWIQRVFG